jgi:hypothetical protein
MKIIKEIHPEVRPNGEIQLHQRHEIELSVEEFKQLRCTDGSIGAELKRAIRSVARAVTDEATPG